MNRRQLGSFAALFAAGAVILTGCGDDEITNGGGGGSNPPTAPQSVGTAEATPIGIQVTWDPADGATGHRAELLAGGSVVRDSSVGGSTGMVTFRGLDAGNTFQAVVVATNSNGETPSDTASLDLPETPAFNNLLADPGLPSAAFSIGSQSSPPDFIPASAPGGYTPFDVTTLGGITQGASSLEATDYPGAVEPGTSVGDAWYSGWTVWTPDGSDSRPASGLPVDTLRGTITSDLTLDAGTLWYLDGIVFAGDDCGQTGGVDNPGDCGGTPVTLTIQPGTTIVGVLGADITTGDRASALVVSRGSQLIADHQGADCSGASTKPTESSAIVFTSENATGSRARGDWGGLVLNGQAPIQGGEAQGEGDSGTFGGGDALDESGCLRGVRVEFAGDNFTESDQLNGIAFRGVGAGTLVDYVQVHYNQDDGTEPFGGTVGLKHVVTSGIGDDSFDGTDGWQGFLQFGIAQQRADDADQCMELSNSGEAGDASPRSTTIVANVTCVGSGVDLGSGEIAAEGDESDVGLLQREGSRMRIFNSIVTGFGASGFDVEGASAAVAADTRLGGSTSPPDVLRFESSVLWSNVAQGDGDENFTDASDDGYTAMENKWFFLSGQ
jgi:hypothetical protein